VRDSHVCVRAFVTSANKARARAHARAREGTSWEWDKGPGEKIHLSRMDEPRSPGAYIFGNSGSFPKLPRSFDLVAETHGSLSIYSALEGTFRALHPAVLIGARSRRRDYHTGSSMSTLENIFFWILFYHLFLNSDICPASKRRSIPKSSYYKMCKLISGFFFAKFEIYL